MQLYKKCQKWGL